VVVVVVVLPVVEGRALKKDHASLPTNEGV
jgi:hypothetical protein